MLKNLMRLYNQAYAFFYGYFWLPCPLCHEMFGGHESSNYSLPPDKVGNFYVICKTCQTNAQFQWRRYLARQRNLQL